MDKNDTSGQKRQINDEYSTRSHYVENVFIGVQYLIMFIGVTVFETFPFVEWIIYFLFVYRVFWYPWSPKHFRIDTSETYQLFASGSYAKKIALFSRSGNAAKTRIVLCCFLIFGSSLLSIPIPQPDFNLFPLKLDKNSSSIHGHRHFCFN